MKKTFLLFMLVLIMACYGWGQQVIGTFPQMDGGYEGQAAGSLTSTSVLTGVQRIDWTVSSVNGTGTIASTGGRSGLKYVSFSNTTSNRRLQSPTAADGAIVNTTSYTIQFYYKSTALASNGQVGVSPDGTAQPGAYAAISLPSTAGVWTKLTQSASSGTSANSPRYGVGVVRFSAASGGTIDIDDFVMYLGAVDNTAPDPPTLVTVSNPGQTTLDIGWTAPVTGVDGGGYAVVRYTANPDATDDPNQNGIFTVGNTFSVVNQGTVAYIGTATSFTDVSLTVGTPYWYKVYTVDKAFNYSSESSGSGTTTAAGGSTLSDITGAGNETANISYNSYQASTISTTADGLRVFSFNLRDGGGAPDGDALPTILSSVIFDKGAGNTVSSWANTLREAALFEGTNKIAEISVSGETLSFSGLSGSSVTAADDGSLRLDLYVTFKTTVTDNQQFQFQIQNTNVTNPGSGSSLFAAFPAVLSSIAGDNNRIEVTATELAYVQQPTNVAVNLDMFPPVTVTANDLNANRDLDYVTVVSITANGSTLTGSPVTAIPAAGLATFSTLAFSTTNTGVTLDAASGSLTGKTSDSFDVEVPPAPGEIVINQFSPDYDGASDEYVELINTTDQSFDLSLLKIEYQSAGGSGGTAGGSLSGIIGPYEFWLLSPNETVTIGLTSDLPRDGAIVAGFAGSGGQLAIRLKNPPYTIIDGLAYGTITLNNLGESTAASDPPTDGGLERTPEGTDSDVNSTDFALVPQGDIYLHCRHSLYITHNYNIPGSSYHNVTLARHNPQVTLAGNTTFSGRLRVYSGNLTIGSTKRLTVNGRTYLDTYPAITLKSDASGTASFIDNGTINGSGTARMERYLVPDAWHNISSPISDATANTFLTDYLRASNPTTASGWSDWIVDPATSLEVMRGYSCWKPVTSSTSEVFTGYLNTGSQSFTGSRSASDPMAGWHLVGNPYPSSINLASGSIDWDEFEPAAYFWDEAGSGNPLYASGNYNVALASPVNFGTHTQYAPPEQGFFVHINDLYEGSSTLTFSNSALVHNNVAFLKDSPVFQNAFLMTVTGNVNAYSDRLTVHFNPEATTGYDPGFDAYKRWGLSEAPQLFTRIGLRNVTCNSLPFTEKNVVIPMGFSCGVPGIYKLAADSLQTFGTSVSILLEDLKLNITQNLRINPEYSFTYDTADSPNRFVLHFTNPAIGIDDPADIRAMLIYSCGNGIYVKSMDGNLPSGTVMVYDLVGKELFRQTLSKQVLNHYEPSLTEGYYLVRVVTERGTFVTKVFLANR